MSENYPLVSIKCVTYNQEEFIEEAIESFLMQKTNFDFEIVIGDDCSTDNTSKIIESYTQKYSNIRHIQHRENLGLMKNWIYTLKACKGKYIAICEGDDYWTDPYKLQKQVDILQAHPAIIVCHHWHKYSHFIGNEWIVEDAPVLNEGYLTNTINTVQKIFNNELRVKSRTMLFRNIIDDGFFPNWYETLPFGDVALNFLLGQKGDFYFINEPMAVYRRVPNSVSRGGNLTPQEKRGFKEKHFKDWIKIWDHANKHYEDKYISESLSTVKQFYQTILNTKEHSILFPFEIIGYSIKNQLGSFAYKRSNYMFLMRYALRNVWKLISNKISRRLVFK